MGAYCLFTCLAAPACFYLTLPDPWTRLPVERLASAAKEISHLRYFEWRALTHPERAQAEAQKAFLEGVHVVFTLCDERGTAPALGWDLRKLEEDVLETTPGSVEAEVTGRVLPCQGEASLPRRGGKDRDADDQPFVWRSGPARSGLAHAEDLSRLSPRSKVLHYVLHLADLDGDAKANASSPERTTFVNMDDFGGVCSPMQGKFSAAATNLGRHLVDSEECGGLFLKHIRTQFYGEKESRAPLYILRKDFDYLQRLILLEGVAKNLKALEDYTSAHFFAPVDEEVLDLLKGSGGLQTPSLIKGGVEVVRRAYLETSAALYHPSLVGTGTSTIPDLHRLLLMCPYFLPVLSVLVKSIV